MTAIVISQTFAGKTGAVVPADLDDAFGDIVSKLDGGVDDAAIAADAGISPFKLQRPNGVYEVNRKLLADGTTAATWVSAPGAFTLDGVPRLVLKDFMVVDTDELLWLCRINVWAIDITAGAGAQVPRVTVYKNGTLLPGATFDLANDDGTAPSEPYYIARSSPIANPFVPFVNGEYIEYRLGYSAAGSNPTARGIYVKETWKRTHAR